MNKYISIIALALGMTASTGLRAQNVNDVPTCIDEQKDSVVADTAAVAAVGEDTLKVSVAVSDKQKQLAYIRAVCDKAVYVQNISSSIDLGLKGMGHSIDLDGKLQMRRNEVIRICISAPFIGMEVARLEFTPTYVLLIDRIHKEYVKAAYDDVAFLKSEGLTFYTLQSLFWNELFQPGKTKLTDSDLSYYTTDMTKPCIRYKTSDTLYKWNTDADNRITYAGMTYGYTTKNYSTVMVNYGNFAALGVKQFPKKLYVTFNSKAFSTGTLSLNMDMNGISTDSNWEALTTVSGRYTQVTAEEFFKQLGSM